MDAKEALKKIATLLSLNKEEEVKTEVEETQLAEEAPVEEAPVEEPTEDQPSEEITIESLQEQLIGIAETLADLMGRVEKLEGPQEEEQPTEEVPEEEMTSETELSADKKIEEVVKETNEVEELRNQITELQAQLLAATAEPILGEEPTSISDSSSYALKMQARIAAKRKARGLGSY